MRKLKNFLEKRKWNDWFLFVVFLFALYMRGPGLIDQFRQQGTLLRPVSLEGKLFPPQGSKAVLVFWASWCGPCMIELNRIDRAILNKEISSTNIYAVNLGEEKDVVNKVIKERKFNFPVIFDPEAALANRLKVRVTPTIVFVDQNAKVDWVTSGVSPFLIYRIKYFLKN